MTNFGPDPATNVVLNDILPSQAQLINSRSLPGVTGVHGVATYDIPSPARRLDSITVTIAGDFESTLGGTVSSSFSVRRR